MAFDVVMLLVSLGLILLASVIFTNAIEVLGQRLGMHQGAVGSILAAVGTALPETVIPLIAILWIRDEQAKQVAVGAIAGAPFMLSTLAFFVTGAAVLGYAGLGRRARVMDADVRVVARDLTFFLVLYGAAILTTFVHDRMAVRIPIAIGLVAAYLVYLKVTLSSKAEEMADVERLYLCRLVRAGPSAALTAVQLGVALAVMVGGGHMFVGYVETVSTELGISALVLSLIITPVATELPEKFNSVIWVGRNKDTLAIGNITGAMVFQCSFPVAFGVVGTPWDLLADHGVTLVSALLAMTSAAIALVWVKARRTLNPFALLVGGALYAVFLTYLLTHMR